MACHKDTSYPSTFSGKRLEGTWAIPQVSARNDKHSNEAKYGCEELNETGAKEDLKWWQHNKWFSYLFRERRLDGGKTLACVTDRQNRRYRRTIPGFRDASGCNAGYKTPGILAEYVCTVRGFAALCQWPFEECFTFYRYLNSALMRFCPITFCG